MTGADKPSKAQAFCARMKKLDEIEDVGGACSGPEAAVVVDKRRTLDIAFGGARHMAEPTISCPNCKTEIRLTESLAAPLIESTRREYEQRLAQRNADIAKREEALSKAKNQLDEQVAERVKQERAKIAAEEMKKARLSAATDLEQKSKEVAELQEVLKSRDSKLAEAQKAQADLIRKQRELDDAKREMELTVEKRIQDGLSAMREQARKQADEEHKLKALEKDHLIASMQKQLDEMKRKVEQGSQQLQGEVQELQLEALLAAKFPFDSIDPVPKGEHGGDAIQRVCSPSGQTCGTILWESKRTKNWSDGWLTKLRDDQRAARADLAVIVSQILPKGVDSFELIEGVWVTHPRTTLPLGIALRNTLIEIASARQALAGQQTKTELVYQYLMGPRFRQRVEAIVEAFSSMQEDLDKEKKAITKQWSKREEQIERVMQATVGMYGDLQGIAGKTLQEIEGLELTALAPPKLQS
jgi:hypothetical protein